MTNAFAEFGVEMRPWLDPEEILSRYHELAILRHPDKCGGDAIPLARLNEARRILGSTPSRLRHLLALTSPPGLATGNFEPDFELFSLVKSLAQTAEKIAAARDLATSRLAAAPVQAKAVSLLKEISPALERIDIRTRALEEKNRSMDAAWPDVPPQELATLAEELSFLKNWRQSLRDAQTRLLGG